MSRSFRSLVLLPVFVMVSAAVAAAQAPAPQPGPAPAPAPSAPSATDAPAPAVPPATLPGADAVPQPAPVPLVESPPPPPGPVVLAAPPSSPSPSADWAADVYARAQHAVVRVENASGTGTGFVFVSPKHVLTAYHLVDSGRSTRVVTHENVRIDARILAIDPENDLAILELAKPVAGATPLAPRTSALRVGEPVIVVGHALAGAGRGPASPFRGLLDWSVTSGVVGAVSDTQLQLDAAVNPGNSGGPVLDAHGLVAGVVTGKLVGGFKVEGLGFATRIAAAAELEKSAGSVAEYTGRLKFGFGGGLHAFGGPSGTGGGVALGLGFTFWDLVALRGHFLLGWGQDNAFGSEIVDRDFFRYGWDAILEYRLALRTDGGPFAASLGGGVGMVFDSVDELIATGSVDGSTCAAGQRCDVDFAYQSREYERDDLYAIGTLGLGDFFRFNFLFDPDDVAGNYILQFMFGVGI